MNNAEEIVGSLLKLINIILDMREDKQYADHHSYRDRKKNHYDPEVARLIELLKTP